MPFVAELMVTQKKKTFKIFKATTLVCNDELDLTVLLESLASPSAKYYSMEHEVYTAIQS